jgi:hypothetical protein
MTPVLLESLDFSRGSNEVTWGVDCCRAVAGNILTDTRSGGLGMTFQYDVEGRLSRVIRLAPQPMAEPMAMTH